MRHPVSQTTATTRDRLPVVVVVVLDWLAGWLAACHIDYLLILLYYCCWCWFCSYRPCLRRSLSINIPMYSNKDNITTYSKPQR